MIKKISRKKGFTLIEVVIATGVLGFVALAIMFGVVASHNLSKIVVERRTAVYHAEKTLEHMRRLTNTQPLQEDCVTGTWSPANWTTWAATDESDTYSGEPGGGCNTLDQEVVTVTVPNTGADPLDVTITVQWQTGGRNLQKQLWALVAKRT